MNDHGRELRLGENDPETAGPFSLSLDRSVLESAHEAFISMDAGGFIVDCNAQTERTFGWSRSEIIGRVLADTIVPERHRAAHWDGLRRYLTTGEGPVLGVRLELTALHRAGHEFPIEMTIAADAREDRVSFHAFLHDISTRKFSERVLLAQHAVTHSLAAAAGPQEAIEALLPALGESMEWELGLYWTVEPHDDVLDMVAIWHAPALQAWEFERRSRKTRLARGVGLPGRAWERGEPVWVDDFTAEKSFPRIDAARSANLHAAICVPALRDGEVVGVIEFLTRDLRARDLSTTDALAVVGAQVGHLLGVLEERQQLLAALETLALTDSLTALPNRRAWEDGLRRELARATRDGHPVCVALIDLDHFKRFNDEHGHPIGDALLGDAATAWRAVLRTGDLLARYGGEEFAALFPAQPQEAAVAVVERLRRATPADQTCSAGVACWDRSETPEELVARADAALYAAKHTGRDRTIAADDPASSAASA